jgi:hypothetical protein
VSRSRVKISKEQYLLYAVLAQAIIDLLNSEPNDEIQIDSALEYVLSFKKITSRLRRLSPEEKRAWRTELLKSLN